MSVIVKDMKMPENCRKCPLLTGTFCDILNKDVDPFYEGAEKRYNNCPLVDLGKHGDLIDRQKLIEDNKHLEYPTDEKYRRDRAWAVGFNAGARHCNEHAVYAKAVIEAEDGS